ncbi:tRNA 2'-phosphotransferase 1-like isoform X3 [Salvia splendens]|uniref:tRNA 2'-phosphotransferase 1-like isoform X3 n=1 Tax=Salvia splendens TaxID=180675 RepID=UPI001C27FB58|nr:tRNA 2'-phosphotransferase 1-like isoform X3 [Salvia splendens]XP_042046511.1 tRNA 2'-phosphotransferase 1-like isoform X3 [Salvia splendens]
MLPQLIITKEPLLAVVVAEVEESRRKITAKDQEGMAEPLLEMIRLMHLADCCCCINSRTRILRHQASDLNLDMRNDGYVKVQDLLKLNLKTMANIPLRSHTVEDIREAVRQDNKQRFSLLEENGELLLRANQGHSVVTVETESLLKPILSPEEISVCVHGTYKKNLESILREGLKRMQRLHVHFCSGLPRDAEVVSGMRRDVDTLIFLDVKKAMEEGMKLYVSDNKVILTEGFDGVVSVKYFQKIESWPQRQPIPF